MIPFHFPKGEDREDSGKNTLFRILDQTDVDLLLKHDSYQSIKAGDLCIILEPDGYEEVAEMFAKRHNPYEQKNQVGIDYEIAELFEGVMCNSEWEWIPQDDAHDISNGEHMFVDDHGDVRVLTGFWTDHSAWKDDQLEKIFVKGFLIYTFHNQSEFSEDQFFNLPPGAQAAWEADDYDTFRDIMDNEHNPSATNQAQVVNDILNEFIRTGK